MLLPSHAIIHIASLPCYLTYSFPLVLSNIVFVSWWHNTSLLDYLTYCFSPVLTHCFPTCAIWHIVSLPCYLTYFFPFVLSKIVFLSWWHIYFPPGISDLLFLSRVDMLLPSHAIWHIASILCYLTYCFPPVLIYCFPLMVTYYFCHRESTVFR